MTLEHSLPPTPISGLAWYRGVCVFLQETELLNEAKVKSQNTVSTASSAPSRLRMTAG